MDTPSGGVDISSGTTIPTTSHTETQDTKTVEITESLPLHLRPDVLERLEKDGTNQNSTEERAEEALDSDQVIELHTFIDRKTWIEEKIRVRKPAIYVMLFVITAESSC
jgi:hypothetical protein